MDDFPSFGICPVCSSDGGDYPAADLTTADSQTNIDETGQGVPLYEYKGQMVCKECKDRLEADSESLLSAKKHAREEAFRSKAGFGGI
jgi:hypothetical protein